MARRAENPITTHVAVLQGLRWGRTSAMELLASIERRTHGYVRIHMGLVYKALDYLASQGLVRRTPAPARRTAVHGRAAASYKLTAKGARVAARDGAELRGLFED